MKQLNVGLVGYYGWGNYGDEFFKEVLDQKLSSVSFSVLHGVGEGGKLIIDDMDQNIEAVDAIMIGGGDLVIPYALSSLYWRDEFLRKPIVVYGVGVPRWGGYDHDVVMRMRAFFQHPAVKRVVARDQESMEWITTHLKPSVPVSREPDIVCAYKHRYIAPMGRAFGLVLRFQGDGVDRAKVRAVLDQVRAYGYHPRILMLATDKTLSDDFKTVCQLDLGDCDIVVRDNLGTLTDELLACDRVASMKFHGCLVAMAHNIPCLALSSANKFKNFYGDLEMSEWMSSLADPALSEKLDVLLRAPGYRFPEAIRDQAIAGLHSLEGYLHAAAEEGVPEIPEAPATDVSEEREGDSATPDQPAPQR